MKQRRIFIGDVHGHYQGLDRLLDLIAPSLDDQVCFVGDLVDRGPASRDVVELVMREGYDCVLGNHELMMLEALYSDDEYSDAVQGWLASGGVATLKSYQGSVPDSHIRWMLNLPLYLDFGDIWVVHAGIDPRIPLEQQTADQFCWVRDAFHQIDRPYFTDKLIITGHTITFNFPNVIPGKIATGMGWMDIDTGAYHPYSYWLTGVDLTYQQVYQVNVKTFEVRILPLQQVITSVKNQSMILSC